MFLVKTSNGYKQRGKWTRDRLAAQQFGRVAAYLLAAIFNGSIVRVV